jgi:hypothetical protein
VSSQLTNLPSLTAGFNAEKSLLRYLIASQRTEVPRSSANNASRTRSEVLSQDLAYFLDDMPPALELWQMDHTTTESTENPLRSLQLGIQRVNIHTTHLWRSWACAFRQHIRNNRRHMSATASPSHNIHSCQFGTKWPCTCKLALFSYRNLLTTHVCQVIKIRQIAASLAGNEFNDQRSEQVKNRAKIYLQKFAALLAELDHNYIDDLQLDSSLLLS